MENSVKKELVIRRVVALISALILGLFYVAFGQVSEKTVFLNGDTIITKHNNFLSFSPISKKDTTYMYVYGQKNRDSEFFGIGVIFPRDIVLETTTITIGFPDNTQIKIKPSLVNHDNQFVQYLLSDKHVEKLSTIGYDYICFDSKTKMVPISWSFRQKYFVDFFVNYYN